MNTIVPEGKSEPSDELEFLRMKLAGNRAFALCRGTFNQRMTHVVEDAIKKGLKAENSRTAVRDSLRTYFAAAHIMGNLLAQLKRDGKEVAYEELTHALWDPSFLIMGETVALEKTIPFTILMLEPQKTLGLMEWVADKNQPITYLERLFSGLTGWDGAPQYELCRVRTVSVSGLPTVFNDSIRLGNQQWNRDNSVSLDILSRALPFVYVFFGKNQAEVLSKIDRKLQDRVATWQINVPSYMLNWSPKFAIGFHTEQEHSIWEGRYPALVSKGVSCGYGAFFLLDPLINRQSWQEYRKRSDDKARLRLSPTYPEEVKFEIR
jgi:hypothetical protein